MTMRDRAKAWIEVNTALRWRTESEYGVEPAELNRRPDKWASRLADFATSEVEAAVNAEREKIADELEDGHSCESNECWTCFYIDRLRSNK